jgi:glycosyltransferase involved in cell wall biosynthesis
MVTLFPIQWPEPFGLVMVESMACGTPVAAIGLGAVPEVVEDGRSGIVDDTVEALIARFREAVACDRADTSRAAHERFSAERMVTDYEAAYSLLLGE